MTDKEMEKIRKEGIGHDCIDKAVKGGDTIRDSEGREFTVVWGNGWMLEDADGKQYAILCRQQLKTYKRVE